MSGDRTLFQDVEVDGRVVDCRVVAGRVAEVGPHLLVDPADHVVRGRAGALLPGLADHHVHVMASAAARSSLDLDGAESLDDAPAVDGAGWLRVVGAGAELDRGAVDARWADRPVRVQHRSGALWTLNTAAVDLLHGGLTSTERRTGQLWRADERLRRLLEGIDGTGGIESAVAAVGRELASYGVTHLTDASPELTGEGLDLIRSHVPQHVVSMAADGSGARKIVIPDHDTPDHAALVADVARWHDAGRPVAIHAVTALAVAMCIAALTEVGSMRGDRIEHAAVCDDGAARRLAELGVVVVTQPSVFARRHQSFLRDTPRAERGLLWRHAGLLRAGVPVVISSDAPYGLLDPAASIAASAQRAIEGVPAAVALGSYLLSPQDLTGGPRVLVPGATADLCLLEAPLDEALARAAAGGALGVRSTYVTGRRVHDRDAEPSA